MKWDQGRATIERMLADGELQRVPPSREQADYLLAQARSHAHSAATVCEDDPEGGYALAYDAARKALAAIRENQGLRATSRGGHIAIWNPSGHNSTRPWEESSGDSIGCARGGTTPSIRRRMLPG
jgi:hypothetical protein